MLTNLTLHKEILYKYKQGLLFIVLQLIIFLLYRDANTIFRGNTLVSKMMDEVMRLAGLHYLHETLRPALEQVFSERKPCEIDPARVKDSAAIQTNMENLKVECSLEKWWFLILTSCPHFITVPKPNALYTKQTLTC